MFTKTSKAGVGLVAVAVYLLVAIGEKYGIGITEADATQLVQNVVGIVGIVLTYWGQYDRKDLSGGLLRK